MSETKSQTDDGRTELPHRSDDADLRYTHVGKQFEVCDSDVTFEIVNRDTSILPQTDVTGDWITEFAITPGESVSESGSETDTNADTDE